MVKFIKPNCFMRMKRFHLKFGTKMASLSLIMAAVKVLLKWFFQMPNIHLCQFLLLTIYVQYVCMAIFRAGVLWLQMAKYVCI